MKSSFKTFIVAALGVALGLIATERVLNWGSSTEAPVSLLTARSLSVEQMDAYNKCSKQAAEEYAKFVPFTPQNGAYASNAAYYERKRTEQIIAYIQERCKTQH